MSAVIECEGAPRDLGLDQGRRCRAAVRRVLAGERRARWLRLVPARAHRAASLDRELRRHFPHLSERLDGLARGAGVGRAALVRALARGLDADPEGGAPPASEATVAVRTASGPLLARAPAAGLAIRRSRPEVGYRSLEVTAPWLVSALAGVNEAGLAAATVALPCAVENAHASAPALFLVQECLQRFASVDSALDWCGRRSAGAGCALLFADAGSDVAGVEVGTAAPGTVGAPDAFVVEAGDGLRQQQIEKACREATHLDARALVGMLADGSPAAGSGVALIDPIQCRLAIAPDPLGSAGEAPPWLCV